MFSKFQKEMIPHLISIKSDSQIDKDVRNNFRKIHFDPNGPQKAWIKQSLRLSEINQTTTKRFRSYHYLLPEAPQTGSISAVYCRSERGHLDHSIRVVSHLW
jgi:hypothetical protein